jgi:hypothetical protein
LNDAGAAAAGAAAGAARLIPARLSSVAGQAAAELGVLIQALLEPAEDCTRCRLRGPGGAKARGIYNAHV